MTSLVAYIPAIHTGYIKFFKKYRGTLFIIDPELLQGTPLHKYLERDLRKVDLPAVKRMVEALGIFKKVSVLTKSNIRNVPGPITMPDDEVSREFASKYFVNKKVTFKAVFLRWGKVITTKGGKLRHREIYGDASDRRFMAEADKEGKRSADWWRQIGAVIVKNGKVLLRGRNIKLPSDFTQDAYGDPRSNFDAGEHIEFTSSIHAEQDLIAQAAEQGVSLSGTSIYVTTFPCPVCAKSIVRAGIRMLYYRDGYSLFDAEKILRAFGVKIKRVR